MKEMQKWDREKGKKGFLQLQSHVHTSVALPGEAGGKVLAFFVF
jgi:hypothetical protein